jgi:hypothetical protein
LNILLAAILLTNVIFLAGFILVFFKIRSVYQQFIDFVTPPAENQPSKLANVCEALSEMIGRSLVASLKTFLMGKKSGEVRAENAEKGQEIDASPVGAIVGMLPKSVRASLIKNPALLDYALSFMARKGGAASNTSGANTSHLSDNQAKFKL